MGTRSLVGVMVDGQCRTIYVHWDGYLEGVGSELQSYKTQEEVEELIFDGDRSSLTEGYYWERGESDVAPRHYDTFEELLEAADDYGAEYYYVFQDGVWYCGDTYGTPISKKLVPYAEAVELLQVRR